jgi:hypothetical protein
MRRIRTVLLAGLVGLAGSFTLIGPAEAKVAHAYYGNRGHAWSNTAGSRIGVEDQRSDGIYIYADIHVTCVRHDYCGYGGYEVREYDDSGSGFRVYIAPYGYRVHYFRVCGETRNGYLETLHGCSSPALP